MLNQKQRHHTPDRGHISGHQHQAVALFLLTLHQLRQYGSLLYIARILPTGEKRTNLSVYIIYISMSDSHMDAHHKHSRHRTWRMAGTASLALILFVCYGTALGLQENTVTSQWIPRGISATTAMLTGTMTWRQWRRLTERNEFVPNYLCHLVAATGMTAAITYGANYVWADPQSRHTEQVTIEKQYCETHYHTQRIGRNHVRRGRAYKVYFMDIIFGNGQHKKLQIPVKQYRTMRTGSVVPLTMELGLLGMPVIKERPVSLRANNTPEHLPLTPKTNPHTNN